MLLGRRLISRLRAPLRSYHCSKCSFADPTQDLCLFCGQCSSILSFPKDVNHFKLLSVERESFHLDLRRLSQNYKRLQVLLHPDKYALKPDDEQELALHWSSAVNEAYQVLKSPVSRILYLLELTGAPLIEEEVEMDPQFLGDIMELNEELEDISSIPELLSFTAENDKNMAAYFEEFSSLWSSGSLEEARRTAAKIKYLENLREKIKETEERLGLIR